MDLLHTQGQLVEQQKSKDFFASKKILIGTHAYPPDSGGIAAFTRDIFVILKNAGSNLSVFNTDKGSSNNGSRLHSYIQMAKTMWYFYIKINKERPDIVITSRLLPVGILGVVFSLFFNFKLVIQVHGTELKGRHSRGWRKWVFRNLYNSADQIWANSQFTSNLLEEYGCKPEAIKIIYPLITKDAQKLAENTLRNKQSKSNKPITIFTAATLYPRKGIDLVLKAVANIADLDWEYRIAGKPRAPAYPGFYERIAEGLEIEKKVTFLGQLDREELWKEMANSDIFVMPSRGYKDDIESFGIVFIEAGLFGVPSIGTKVGGISEAIGDGGVLIEDENIKELTRSIENLVNNKEARDELSEKASSRVLKKFTEESRRKDIYEAFTDLDLN